MPQEMPATGSVILSLLPVAGIKIFTNFAGQTGKNLSPIE